MRQRLIVSRGIAVAAALQPEQLRNPAYMTDVRRFLRHLENAGAVVVPDGVDRLDKYLAAFAVARSGRLQQADL